MNSTEKSYYLRKYGWNIIKSIELSVGEDITNTEEWYTIFQTNRALFLLF